jgi:hypothetical protein
MVGMSFDFLLIQAKFAAVDGFGAVRELVPGVWVFGDGTR